MGELKYRLSGETFVGSFIGYVPEALTPIAELKEISDRNKILQREAVSKVDQPSY